MENLRKRTEREVADARQYGIAGFARDVLAVADNMHRALATIEPAQREAADPTVKAMIEGVELTERELMKALEKNGVQANSRRRARSSIRICIRRCTKCRTRTCRPAMSRR